MFMPLFIKKNTPQDVIKSLGGIISPWESREDKLE